MSSAEQRGELDALRGMADAHHRYWTACRGLVGEWQCLVSAHYVSTVRGITQALAEDAGMFSRRPAGQDNVFSTLTGWLHELD